MQKTIAQWLQAISEAKNSLLLPSMLNEEYAKEIYEAYDASLRACNAVDYDDLLLLTYRLFEERPQVSDFYRRQYRYISVDEAQDLNEAQYRLLCALCGTAYFNMMLVGDPKQAIYVWNGANPKYMDLFERDFKARRIVLTENFRSSEQVVSAAQRLDPTYIVEGQLPIRGSVEVTVQVPQSIFLDFCSEVCHFSLDECESGSPRKGTRGRGEGPPALQPAQP